MQKTNEVLKSSITTREISIEKKAARVMVYLDGKVIADTGNALALKEGWLPPVMYIPREDVDMSLLTPGVCGPSVSNLEGRTCYYLGGAGSSAAWAYDDTSDAAAAIKQHIAFDVAHVDAIEEHPL